MKIHHIMPALFFATPSLLLAAINVPPEFDTPDKKLLFATVHNDVDLARQALSSGAKLEAEIKGVGTHTPLQVCGVLGNLDVAALLLEKGASQLWLEGFSDSAIGLAAEYNQTDIMKLLITYADRLGPERASLYESAFAGALKNGHLEVVKLLIQAGIDPISGFYRHARNPQRDKGFHGNPILCLAADHGDPAMIRYLLEECGLDANKNHGYPGNHPLWIAVSRGNLEAARLLIAKGADVNVTAYGDPRQMSCLAVALRCGHLDCADLLLKSGAKPTAEKSDPASLSKITADWAGFDAYADRIAGMGVKLTLWDLLQEEFKSKKVSTGEMKAAPVGGLAAHLLEGDWVVSSVDAETKRDSSPRVAILGDKESSVFSDSLLVAMSGVENVEFVERNELDRVIREHELDRAGLIKHKRLRDLSNLIAADSLILVSTAVVDKTKVYRIQWLDVKRGLVLNVRYASADERYWSEFSAQYTDFFTRSLLTQGKGERVPVSLIGVTANWATPEGRRLEKDLFYMIQHALSKQPGLLLLDRQSLEKLASEKRLGSTEGDAFHNSALFLNVRVDVNLSSGDVEKIVLEAVKAEQSDSDDLKFEELSTGSTLIEDSMRIVSRLAGSLTEDRVSKKPSKSVLGSMEADSKALVDEAYWLYRMRMYAEAQVAIENAVALGVGNAGAWKLYLMILQKVIPTLWLETRGDDENNRRIIDLEHDRLRAFGNYLRTSHKGKTDELGKKLNWSIHEVLEEFSYSLFRMRPVSLKRQYRNEISELEDLFRSVFDLVIKPLSEKGQLDGRIRDELMLSVFLALPNLNFVKVSEHERLVRESISGLERYWCMCQMYPRSVEGGFKRWNEWVRKYGTPSFVSNYYQDAGEYLFYWDGRNRSVFSPRGHNADAYQDELAEYLKELDSTDARILKLQIGINSSQKHSRFYLSNAMNVVAMPLDGQKLYAEEYLLGLKCKPIRQNAHYSKSLLSIYSSVSLLWEMQRAEQLVLADMNGDPSIDEDVVKSRKLSIAAIGKRIQELTEATEDTDKELPLVDAYKLPLVDAYVWDLKPQDPQQNQRFNLWYGEQYSNCSVLFQRDGALWTIGKHWNEGIKDNKVSLYRMDERSRETSVQAFDVPEGKDSLFSGRSFILFSDTKIVLGAGRQSSTIVLDRKSLSVSETNEFIPYEAARGDGKNFPGGYFPSAYIHDDDLYYTAIPRYLMPDSGLIKAHEVRSGLVFLKLDLNTMQHTVLFNFRRKPAETPLDHPLEDSNYGGNYGFRYNESEGVFLFIHNHNKYLYQPVDGKFTKLADQEFKAHMNGAAKTLTGWKPDSDGDPWYKQRFSSLSARRPDGGIRVILYNYKSKELKSIGLRLKTLSGGNPGIISEVEKEIEKNEYQLTMPSEKYSAIVLTKTAKIALIENRQLSEAIKNSAPIVK